MNLFLHVTRFIVSFVCSAAFLSLNFCSAILPPTNLKSRVIDSFKKYFKLKSFFKAPLKKVRFRFAQAASAVLIGSILVTSTPAMIPMTLGTVASYHQSTLLYLGQKGWFVKYVNSFLASFSAAAPVQREISRIEILPGGTLHVGTGTKLVFTAVAYDSNNEAVPVERFHWRATNIDAHNRPAALVNNSTFEANYPGNYKVTAKIRGIEAEVNVKVTGISIDEVKRGLSNAPVRTVSTREYERRGNSATTGNSEGSDEKQREEVKENPAKKNANVTGDSITSNNPETVAGVEGINNLPESGWNENNYGSIDEPGNQTGNPAGSPMDDGASNANFQLAAPVLSLPGRGIDLGLSLNYNSRLWNKSGSTLSYDIDKGFPAPGWSFGFGKMVYVGTNGGCMVVDADGTRHGYWGEAQNYNYSSTNWSESFNGYTTDGKFIDYNCYVSVHNGVMTASAKAQLPNGTTITYGASGSSSEMFPTQILDANGNYITIVYRNNQGPQIDKVTDTMNRTVQFNYDVNNRLTSVTGPGFGHTTRTLVRLHYKQISLADADFASTITRVPAADETRTVLNAIYYPGTQTGYWFGEPDSYSPYGMLAKVIEQRGMNWTPDADPNSQGTFTPTSSTKMTKQAVYNYKPAPSAGYIDAPEYDTLTETWDGIDDNAAVTSYLVNNTDTVNGIAARSVTVTQPASATQPVPTISKQYTYKTTDWKNGLVFEDETYVMNGSTKKVLSRSRVDWGTAPGDYRSPRPVQLEKFDEQLDNPNRKTVTTFSYGTNFNQVTSAKEYGYGGSALLRETRTAYENSSSYIGQRYKIGNSTEYAGYSGRHIFNLVKATETFDSVGAKLTRTEFEYDNNHNGTRITDTLANTPGVVQHAKGYNPNDISTEEYNCKWVCPTGQSDPSSSNLAASPCNGPEDWVCNIRDVYDPSAGYRGNVTKVTSYAKVDSNNATDPVTETRQYDITGNVVSTSSSCCEQTRFFYDLDTTAQIDTQYAYPVTVTRGSVSSSLHRDTIYTDYDFNTGLVTNIKDANERISTKEYDPNTLRPIKSKSPSGAYATFAYNDGLMTITEEVYEAPSLGSTTATLAGKSVKKLNGLGQVKSDETLGVNNVWNVVEATYDNQGREWKQSNPYRTGETKQWDETKYDVLGRVKEVIGPDGSSSKAFYNDEMQGRPDSALPASTNPGQTVLSRDAWNRERWARYDEQDRLVEVVEPNPNGSGSVFDAGSLVTRYKYNTLGNLIETEQWNEARTAAQRRKFAYDSLGRLTKQKLAEQTEAFDDTGVYVGAGAVGAQWSEIFKYDNQSNLIERLDPRGVKTVYSYRIEKTGDPLYGSDDPLNRLQSVSYEVRPENIPQPGVTLPIHTAPKVTYEYETGAGKDKTRIKKITAAGTSTEDFLYNDSEGRLSDYTLTVLTRPNHPMTTSYVYDSLDRVKEVHYPKQYGQTETSSNPLRKIVRHAYNTTGELTTLQYNGQTQASEFAFNAAGQISSMKVGTGANQLTEEYNFDPVTGLLTNQKVKRGSGERLLDLSYEYRRKLNGSYIAGRTGNITEIVNNLDANKNRAYEYDALGRLVKAVGGINQTWTQRYSYDRYGNRKSVTAAGMEALLASHSQSSISADPANPIQRNKGVSNTDLGKSVSAETPPSAEQLVQNVNNLIKVGGRGGKGASSDSPNSGNEDSEEVVTKPVNNSVLNNKAGSEKSINQKDAKEAPPEEKSVEDKSKSKELNQSNPLQGQTADQKQSQMQSGLNNTALSLPVWTPFDFDGDGKADLSTWGRTNGNWKINRSGSGQTTTTQLGASGNQIAPGDYDGDGKTDEAVWNPSNGVWTIKRSSTGAVYSQSWGMSGDAIVPADYDGDGRTDIAVWRPSTGYWYALRSSDGSLYALQWGGQQFGDIPTVGDYDGDGRSDAAVWRPSNGDWYIYILQSSSGQIIQAHWGQTGDVPVPMDYDADRKTDLAVWRPSAGAWYISQSSNGQFVAVALGSESTRDVLVPADYDGDGRADAAVWTPSTGTWTIRQSTTGTNVSRQLGASGELAVPSAYIRRSSAPKNQNADIQRDGHADLSYDSASNRITTSNATGKFEYDAAGNQTRALAQDGQTWLQFEYDAANRLVYVKNNARTAVLQSFTYGATNQRLITKDGTTNDQTYYASAGGGVIAEYTEYASQPNNPLWTKSYLYLGNQLLSTITANGAGAEAFEYHHSDQLGTRLLSSPATGGYFEQATLPFGTALNSESTGATNRRFTSYDRSPVTNLDYALNRTYDSAQGRFTQVDPIGMNATTLTDPQTLNLYTYCGNDPINFADPDGLFFGSLFKAIGKAIWSAVKRVVHAAIKAAQAALFTLVVSGFDIKAAAAVFVATFIKELGWRSSRALTPSWNPNSAHPLNSRVSNLDKYIIVNLMANNIYKPPTPDDILRRVYLLAQNAMGKQACRDFITKGGASDLPKDPRTILRRMYQKQNGYELHNKAPQTHPARPDAAANGGTNRKLMFDMTPGRNKYVNVRTSVINLWKPFFLQGVRPQYNVVPNFDFYKHRTVLLLHELKHVYYGGAPASHDDPASNTWNDEIVKKCF